MRTNDMPPIVLTTPLGPVKLWAVPSYFGWRDAKATTPETIEQRVQWEASLQATNPTTGKEWEVEIPLTSEGRIRERSRWAHGDEFRGRVLGSDSRQTWLRANWTPVIKQIRSEVGPVIQDFLTSAPARAGVRAAVIAAMERTIADERNSAEYQRHAATKSEANADRLQAELETYLNGGTTDGNE